MKVCGKAGVIIGGARGIGRACAEALLKHGMKVVIGDVLEDVGKKTMAELLEKNPFSVEFTKCDITKENDIKALFELVKSKYGKVEVFANFAGIVDEFDGRMKMIDINFGGVVRSTYIALDFMSTEEGGSGGVILHTASTQSFIQNKHQPVYCATKHAILGFVMSFGDEDHYKRTGVRVNCLCPCLVLTSIIPEIKDYFTEEREQWTKTMSSVGLDQCAEGMICLIEDDSLNGEAMVMSPNKGNFLHDKTREREYAQLL